MSGYTRWPSRGSSDWVCALGLVTLLSCGKAAEHSGAPDAGPSSHDSGLTAGSGGSPAGASSDSGGGATGQGGAAGGTAGAAGTELPTADVSGRWGLFVFEDPVGVLLHQEADGTITGQGCGSGAPGGGPPQQEPNLWGCGSLSGRTVGKTASFAFPTPVTGFQYQATVVISADGQRMTGTLTTSTAKITYPLAWHRVRDDAAWLDRGDFMRPDPMAGRYELTLIPEESVGNEFVAGTPYAIRYGEHTILGQLGSFWTDEISPVAEGSPLRVGPVSATVPELPNSLLIDFDAGGFTGVTASTPSGGHYRFAVTKPSP